MFSKVEGFRLTLLGEEITSTAFAKDLGVIMDSCMTYNEHIASTACSSMARLGQINRVKNAFDTATLTIINLTNRFHVAVRLFSNRSQMTSKCGKSKNVAHEAQPSVSLMFLPHFDVFCDLLLNQTRGNMEPIFFIQ